MGTRKQANSIMSKTVKIGNTNIGLLGIEGALNQLKKEAAGSKISPAQAGARLLEAIKKRNYVPPSAEDRYLQALARLWEVETGGSEDDDSDDLRIRILGPGCVSCNRLEEMVLSVLSERGLAADIEHVKDLDEIWRYGVIQTPALVVGRRVLCSGRMPNRAQIEAWFRELMP